MAGQGLTNDLFTALCAVPIFDAHSHIDPMAPTAKSLDDLLGYHYYTELAHSAGMSQDLFRSDADPRERCRAILAHAAHFDNTAQYGWLLEIARTFLGFTGTALTPGDSDALFDATLRIAAQPDWERQVIAKTNLERVFLTNSFDDPLDGFDRKFYVPCLRTDELVFQLHTVATLECIKKSTGIDVGDWSSLRRAIGSMIDRFTKAGAKACAISLPPGFAPRRWDFNSTFSLTDPALSLGVFWMLAELCNDYQLPFDLMIGVNRRVYPGGVYQGQDLFDQRTSLIQYAELFNAFPTVKFPVSVLASGQNQELVAHSWIFPNVFPHGHWWYSNVPTYIESDLRARLQAVPKTKLLGYYSDAYKLEFVLPKFNMYRRILAKVLAEDFVQPGKLNEEQAIDLGKLILRGNADTVFGSA